MSEHPVNIFAIEIEPHPDPETTALECAKIGDFRVVVGKGAYKTGDKVAYIPQDSILPDNIIDYLGLEGRLAGKEKNRVKAIRLRGQLSQGLVYPMPDREIGDEVSEELGITKYDPPIPASMDGDVFNATGKTLKYGIENLKRYPDVLHDGEEVVMTEKIHGTWTCLGMYEGEPIVSSKGLSAKGLAFKSDQEGNLYRQQYELHKDSLDKLADMLDMDTFYVLGETYGQGVQDMQYGLNKRQFRAFDVYVGKPTLGHYLSWKSIKTLTSGLIDLVPDLYTGPYAKGMAYGYANAPKSTLADCIPEGIVIKPTIERHDPTIGRVILKLKSDAYETRKQGTEYN